MKENVPPMDRTKDKSIPYIVMSLGSREVRIKRVSQTVKGKTVVILKKEKPVIDITRSIFPIEILAYNLGSYSGPSYVFDEPGNVWSEAGKEPNPSFNCHALALGERVGLTPLDWIEGATAKGLFKSNPMDILLNAYFDLPKLFDATVAEAFKLAEDQSLQDGDLIVFTGHSGGIAYTHSGIIRKINGKNWMIGKHGEGKVLVSPIYEPLKYFLDIDQMNGTQHVKKIRIYR